MFVGMEWCDVVWVSLCMVACLSWSVSAAGLGLQPFVLGYVLCLLSLWLVDVFWLLTMVWPSLYSTINVSLSLILRNLLCFD